MSKKLILLSLLFCSVILLHAQGKNVSINDFGAVANDGKDDTKALRKAVAFCQANPGTTLFFPPGTYILKDEQAVELEQKAMDGKFGDNPEKVIYTPYYPYSKGLDFTGSKNITIEADKAVLLCEGWMEPVSVIGCSDFHLRGLTIDYKRKPFSHGEIINVENDFFDVQFSPERVITDQMPLMRMTIWDKVKNRMYPEPIYFPRKTILDNNVVRFYNRVPKELKGANAGILHCFHFRPAILIHESENTCIEEVTIHSQAGMGIVGFDSKDILIKGLQVVPAPGYYISTNTDATHFACCMGLLRFEGCVFQGQGDDATNVHGYYQSIVSSDGKKAVIQVKAGTYTHAQVLDAPRVNDELELVEINTLKPVKTYKVVEVTPNKNEFTSIVELSEALPANFADYYLMNCSKLPRLEFENSLINSHLARGILVKTRNVLINNNVFRNCTGTAIHVGAEANWHEGTHAKNVIITNNVMVGCGKGGGSQGGASGIAVIIEAKDTKSSYLHENIKIENNTIVGENNDCGIYIGNARNVVMRNNLISNCKQDVKIHSSTEVSLKNE